MIWEAGPRWPCTWTLSLLSPKNTLNVHLYLEQFFLRDNCEPLEQLLHNKQENHQSSPRAEGATQDQKNQWMSLFMYPLNVDRGRRLHPGSLAEVQGPEAYPQPPLLELDPIEIGGTLIQWVQQDAASCTHWATCMQSSPTWRE